MSDRGILTHGISLNGPPSTECSQETSHPCSELLAPRQLSEGA